MPRPIRRVVTGHNAQGRAVFISDGPAPAVFDRGPGATAVTELWETAATPASNAGNDDPTLGGQQRLPPPKNGSKFRVVEYPPDSQRVAALRAPDSEPRRQGRRAMSATSPTSAIPASTRPTPSTTRSCCPAKSMR